jgi:hypothetical protein
MMAQPTGPFSLRPRQENSQGTYGGVDSGEQRRGEVGPWVGEMASEVGDPIWSSVKKEAHQRAVFVGAWLGWRGTTMRGGIRWWRSAAGGRDMGGHWDGIDGSRRWSEVAR